jgi:alpha-tubulin suppressor-like RCC1 family protein
VVVGNAVGSVVSSGAVLVVVERPVVVTQPVSRYVTAGDLHTVTVGIRGSEPLSYQWYRKLKGGVGVGELIAGATSATYTLPAMVADVGGTNAVAGDYWVRVTNAAGEVTTQAARLWEGGPAISELADRAQALPGPARLGGTLVFRSVFQCIGTLTMGWYRGGVGLVHDEAGWSGGVPTKSDAVSIVNREIGVPGEGLWESVLTVGRVTAASVGRYAVTVRETVSGSVATREIGPVTVAGPARPQTITFSAIGNKRVGDRPFDLRATSGSGLPVTVDILRGSEVVTLGGAAGRTVTLIPGMTGLVVLRATQAGNSTFSAAVPVVRAFLVTSSDMAAYRRVTASRHRFNDASPNFASHVMGIRFDGTMWGWGLNDAGQTGTGGGELVVTPQPVMPERKWLDVSAGELFTVAIAVDGTLWGWGANGAGQLGNGTGAGSAVPVQVSGITGWVSVSAGREHALGIRLNENGLRELWGWGGNGYGQVGDGSMASRFEPVRIGGATDHWLSASAGDQHSLGIRARVAGATHGELMAWGDNAMGQLGTGNRVSSLQPVAVGKDNWRVVDAGVLASAGIDSAGKLATWGLGDSGKLGHGTTGQSVLAPLRIPTLTGQTFRSVSYGRSHVVALTSGGEMYTWGNNVHGQCGSLDTNQYLPRLILPYQGNVRWVQGVAGNAQTLLVSNTMTFCPVGYANQGELGLGFLKSTWLAASGSAVPRARFEVTMAPPAEVRVGADGSVAVAVGMIQPSTLINPVAIWTADGGSVVAYGAQTYTLTASTEPGLTLPDGSRVVVYVVVFPPGPDATRVPREVGFTVRGTIPANRLGSPQTLEFPFPAIPVR